MRLPPPAGRSPRRTFPRGAWALALGLAALTHTAVAGERPVLPANSPRRNPIVDVVERVRDCVVNIHSERNVAAPAADELFTLAPSPSRVNGMGSGIIIDPRGYIVTNQHVVDDVQVLRVRLSDGSTYGARVVAREPEADLALLKIEANRPLPTPVIGTASDLMLGETVIAIGNAYGYEHTTTTGIVSALKRDVTLNKDVAYKSLIQTDAAINPGNSGGPLFNVQGELIGVNVAIRAGAQCIAFAIPVDQMVRVSADMLSTRRRNGVWHGLTVRDQVEPNVSPARRSVVVERAESGSPAAAAGFQRGDVIVQVGDLKTWTGLDLERALLDKSAGEKVPVVVQRELDEKTLELVLQPLDRSAASPVELVWRKLGVRLQTVATETVSRVKRELHGGLTVVDVRPESVAGRAGLQRGDILIGLHQWETLSLDNVVFVLSHPDLTSFSPMKFFIIRGGQLRQGTLPQIN